MGLPRGLGARLGDRQLTQGELRGVGWRQAFFALGAKELALEPLELILEGIEFVTQREVGFDHHHDLFGRPLGDFSRGRSRPWSRARNGTHVPGRSPYTISRELRRNAQPAQEQDADAGHEGLVSGAPAPVPQATI